jgi:hypothetical protein
MITAYLGNKASEEHVHLTNGFPRLSRADLTSSFVIVYILIVKFALGYQNWSSFLHWLRGISASTESAMTKVSSTETVTRITSSVSTKSMNFLARCAGSRRELREGRSPVISAKELFLPVDHIAQLTLSDIKSLLRLAQDFNLPEYDQTMLLSTLRPTACKAALAMCLAVSSSRGPKISVSVPREDSCRPGDTDALIFAAFVRIFAEWRSLRLVPDGYQRFAVGMSLAKRDLVQNVHKLETAVHAWISHQEAMQLQECNRMGSKKVSTLHTKRQFRLRKPH